MTFDEDAPIEEAEDEVKFDSNMVITIAIIVAVGMILAGGGLIIYEIVSAKNSCEEMNYDYDFNIPYEHLCNSKPFFKYNTGWDFEKRFNISEFNLDRIVYP